MFADSKSRSCYTGCLPCLKTSCIGNSYASRNIYSIYFYVKAIASGSRCNTRLQSVRSRGSYIHCIFFPFTGGCKTNIISSTRICASFNIYTFCCSVLATIICRVRIIVCNALPPYIIIFCLYCSGDRPCCTAVRRFTCCR